jgi:hypothetical protein
MKNMKMDKGLPESNASKDGATKSAMGEASMADLDKGFTKIDGRSENMNFAPAARGGFAGRSNGWER